MNRSHFNENRSHLYETHLNNELETCPGQSTEARTFVTKLKFFGWMDGQMLI